LPSSKSIGRLPGGSVFDFSIPVHAANSGVDRTQMLILFDPTFQNYNIPLFHDNNCKSDMVQYLLKYTTDLKRLASFNQLSRPKEKCQ
jgi:hypothetical protein